MFENEFFVIDMASCSSTGEIINNISLALETLNHTGKKIVLKLNDKYFNQSQMLSIQSLITSYGCTLDTIETVNEQTKEIAENMNIIVQKPIEKRVEEECLSKEEKLDFQPFDIGIKKTQEDMISLKNVNGLHFEADLDAIERAQNSINISSDLKQAGVDIHGDFEDIEEQIALKYVQPHEVVKNLDDYSKIANPSSEINLTSEEKIENAEKNSIGVYKKAYDEMQLQEESWEDVDFYETSTNEPIVSDTKETTYINQTLRSGQILEADGNVVIIGDCHPGSEIRAVGDITVWGVLSGIAHAGYKGSINSRVRALKLNAVQLRIANCYSRRPDGTNIPYIIKSSIFTPEEARIVDNEIMLYKINQD